MQKLIIRISDELLDLIEHPRKITPAHYHCLWCGMVKAFPNRPCEICNQWGNTRLRASSVFVTYANTPATRKIVKRVKPGCQ